ncbi:ABC transporter substrate-binding protein [Herbidospora cretacea]|uniref:ABC transporter substrate-binding protein n=1 Tax=Herbidospora cretacea TaxID=28444 RepID=UPI000772FE67|nr:extracellular solute-binding protein [Herbidospora cretacea]
MRRLAVPLALFLAAISACGGVGGSSGGGAAAGSTLTTMGFGLPDEIATTRVDAFTKAHPDIRLTINQGQFDEQAFLSSVASGNAPDLVYLPRDKIGGYAARGALQPITGCVADHAIPTGDYYPAAARQVQLGGQWYGIPEFYNSVVLIVNDKAAEDAGVDPAEIDTRDWDALAALARKMTKSSGGTIERLGFHPKLPEFLPLWAKANGADLLSADGLTPHLDDPKVAEALAYAAKLVEEQGGWTRVKAFADTFDYFGAGNPFAKDQLGMLLTEQFVVSAMAGADPDAAVTVLPFLGRDGAPVNSVGGNAWAVPKGAKNPGGACTWMKEMTAADTWIAAARARQAKRAAEGKVDIGTYTGNQKADAVIFGEMRKPSGREAYDDAVEVIRSVQQAGFTVPPSKAAAEFTTAYQQAGTRVLQGEQTAEEALGQAQAEAVKALGS